MASPRLQAAIFITSTVRSPPHFSNPPATHTLKASRSRALNHRILETMFTVMG
ncbi:Hypothetical protein SMAX5B_011634 [Scophthalmus maximus]|nr:Hypothetical protein SMAX5B_011634 [Scophthalmus maximus]